LMRRSRIPNRGKHPCKVLRSYNAPTGASSLRDVRLPARRLLSLHPRSGCFNEVVASLLAMTLKFSAAHVEPRSQMLTCLFVCVTINEQVNKREKACRNFLRQAVFILRFSGSAGQRGRCRRGHTPRTRGRAAS
jgi:hypothetical protein